MVDLRTVSYLLGLLLALFGATMLAPAAVDALDGSGNWPAFLISAGVTSFVGVGMALACGDREGRRVGVREAFFITTVIWVVSPMFGALPFVLGAPGARFVDAYFEAMSGLTTTGATVFAGLEFMPPGVLLWRAMMQWFGGIGIIVVALAIFPSLGVGGMQLFKSESFDTQGKILPRASAIAESVSWVYVALTILCALAYSAAGMEGFDAITHAMTTIATGGFANHDASFGAFGPEAEYVAILFMALASLPLVRFVQLLGRGGREAMLSDTQIATFLGIVAAIVAAVAAWRLWQGQGPPEEVFRRTLFNALSVITGTGYASEDYGAWGALPVAALFFAGLIGGCSGSATCAIKVFRFQVLVSAVRAQVKSIHSPSGVFFIRFEGRRVDDAVLSSIISFFYFFGLTLVIVTVALAMMGLDPITALSGAASALANIGPGFGPEIGPSGNFANLPDQAKWLLAATMLVGRLELLSVFVLFTAAYWRP